MEVDDTIGVRAAVLQALLAEARRSPQIECCGLLGGRHGVVTTVFSARNTLASPRAFEIAPEELFRFFREMRAAGLEHLGIYHSHPTGENAPSERDIARAYYPEVAYFVLSPQPGAPRPARAFKIREGRVAELAIQVVAGPLERVL